MFPSQKNKERQQLRKNTRRGFRNGGRPRGGYQRRSSIHQTQQDGGLSKTIRFHELFEGSVKANLLEKKILSFCNDADSFFASSVVDRDFFESTLYKFVSAQDEFCVDADDFFEKSLGQQMRTDEKSDRREFRIQQEAFEHDANTFFEECWMREEAEKRRKSEEVDTILYQIEKWSAEKATRDGIERDTKHDKKFKLRTQRKDLESRTDVPSARRLSLEKRREELRLDLEERKRIRLEKKRLSSLDEKTQLVCAAEDIEGREEKDDEDRRMVEKVVEASELSVETLEFYVAEIYDEEANGDFEVTYFTSPASSKTSGTMAATPKTDTSDDKEEVELYTESGFLISDSDTDSDSETADLLTPTSSSADDEEEWWWYLTPNSKRSSMSTPMDSEESQEDLIEMDSAPAEQREKTMMCLLDMEDACVLISWEPLRPVV